MKLLNWLYISGTVDGRNLIFFAMHL